MRIQKLPGATASQTDCPQRPHVRVLLQRGDARFVPWRDRSGRGVVQHQRLAAERDGLPPGEVGRRTNRHCAEPVLARRLQRLSTARITFAARRGGDARENFRQSRGAGREGHDSVCEPDALFAGRQSLHERICEPSARGVGICGRQRSWSCDPLPRRHLRFIRELRVCAGAGK